MAWIRIIEENEATGNLAKLYESLLDPESGRVDDILKIHGLHPPGLRAHVQLYTSAMRGTPGLPEVDRELIAFVVSGLNECHY